MFMLEHVREGTKYILLVINKSFYEDAFFTDTVAAVDQDIPKLVDDIAELTRKGVVTSMLDKKKINW